MKLRTTLLVGSSERSKGEDKQEGRDHSHTPDDPKGSADLLKTGFRILLSMFPSQLWVLGIFRHTNYRHNMISKPAGGHGVPWDLWRPLKLHALKRSDQVERGLERPNYIARQ